MAKKPKPAPPRRQRMTARAGGSVTLDADGNEVERVAPPKPASVTDKPEEAADESVS